MVHQGVYDSPLGEILARWQGERLTGLDFVPPEEGLPLDPIPEKLKTWLDVYFSGRDPGPAPMALDPAGTPFQKRVWQAMAVIPYGETATYGALAAQAAAPGQNPRLLARAAGRAVGANPILILLPCHRVLGAGGALTGFRAGLERKKWLLAGEGSLPGQPEKIRNKEDTRMAYLGEEIKKLGFGLMRLPQKDGAIDLEETKAMVDKFIEAGFTYFDTAWAYPGSEEAIRKALVERYPRNKFQLATKCAAWLGCKTREEAEAQFTTSLERTGAGYFDFYLLHNLGQGRTHVFDDWDIWNFALEKKRQGLIRHLGFSFHSTAQELDKILTAHPEAEFVQLQINYADWESPDIQSRDCYQVARRHHKPVIIMEPVKGGTLAAPPRRVKEVFQKADPKASCASWAIKFAASLEGIITVLSGMSNLEQMEDNLSYMKGFTGLTPEERQVIETARKELASIPMIPCTGCDYCAKVCPKNVGISGTFTAMNLLLVYENLPAAKRKENARVAENGKANAAQCIRCGRCEEVCPQHIPIREELKRAAQSLL